MSKNYTIGLDIGTNSVGWAVMTEDYQLIRRKMKIKGDSDKKYVKKNFWGVRLFDEGQPAAERRLKRTTRRRTDRRRNRLNYLEELFSQPMNEVDESFFHRLGESFLIPDDKLGSPQLVFPTWDEEVQYHQAYPTIYHLRKKLADSTEKADLRLVYLAISHLLKYRGHFLIEGKLSTENSSIQETFKNFLNCYNQTFNVQEDGTEINSIDERIDATEIFKGNYSRAKRAEGVLALLPGQKSNGTLAQFIKMIVGNQGNFTKVIKELDEEVKLQFPKEDYEEQLEEFLAKVGDEYADVFLAAKKVYDAVELANILTVTDPNTKAKLSASMIQRYEEHKTDLKKFKTFIMEKLPEQYYTMFKDEAADGYAGYIAHGGKTPQKEFYNFVKKMLDGVEGAEYFIAKIEQENFLRKQRTFDNGVIPHQIHLEELTAILNRQAAYYPFLAENVDKIKQLLTFRIPYYVGPLGNGESQFAWLSRKTDEPIRPWNIEDIVDIQQSAVGFIERMTSFDTYFPQEKVLPKHSLLYEKYMIFNELTKVSYKNERGQDCKFYSQEKVAIFEKLFKQKRKVSKKDLEKFLRDEYNLEVNEISGIETRFNAGYGTYQDLLKCGVPKAYLDNSENEAQLEELIKILTIFEDRKMIRQQLNSFEADFDKKTLKNLERRHYQGWGRLSEKLLNGIRDQQTHKTILDYLIADDAPGKPINRNLMQLLNDNQLSFKGIIEKAHPVDENQNLHELVKGLAGSPAIKKGILQSLKIVEELVGIMGYLPSNIVVEMARENQTTAKGRNNSKPRLKSLEKGLAEIKSDLLKVNPADNKALQNDRLYLYYLQNGRDMYTGDELNIHALSHYDIDHIIPQSFIVDNSLDNRVLVSQAKNRGKSNGALERKDIIKHTGLWEQLYKAGLMSKRKYDNLMKMNSETGLTDDDKAGFIQRQLVETRQITKNVANILHQRYNTEKDTEGNLVRKVRIVTLKSSLTSQFRKTFELYKVREINDYHHAHDAYLNAVVASALLGAYPKLEPEFVYGEFPKFNAHKANKATAQKQLYTNIMKFFKETQKINKETGEIVWDKQSLATVCKVLESRQVNIVKKTEIQKGGFSKESIQPKGESDKLIPRKNNWETTKYGGFDSPTVAYSIVITYEKGKRNKLTKAILGISIMQCASFEKNEVEYLEKKGYKNPQVEIRLPKYTLYEFENGRRRLLASSSESQKGNQLILPSHLVKLLYHSQHYGAHSGESKIYVEDHKAEFVQILQHVQNFAEKFILADKNLATILNIYEENKDADTAELAESFVNLMRFSAMGAPADFKFFGKNISRKRYTSTTELLQAVIINQSITGLYETHKRLDK